MNKLHVYLARKTRMRKGAMSEIDDQKSNFLLRGGENRGLDLLQT